VRYARSVSIPAKKKATLDDLARMRDAGRVVELIAGEIVEKAAATPEHGTAELRFGGVLDGFNRRGGGPRGPGGWWLMTEVEVLYEKTDEVFRHDVLGFRRDRLASRPAGLPVKERPDWVCEILSPSTARYDVVQKRRTLHAHGVPHYWILDPEREMLTVLRHAEPGYIHVLDAAAGEVVRAEPFDAVEISVSELLGRDD
jgi:Uma2 family endonuclease